MRQYSWPESALGLAAQHHVGPNTAHKNLCPFKAKLFGQAHRLAAPVGKQLGPRGRIDIGLHDSFPDQVVDTRYTPLSRARSNQMPYPRLALLLESIRAANGTAVAATVSDIQQSCDCSICLIHTRHSDQLPGGRLDVEDVIYGITATRRFFRITTGAGASLRAADQDEASLENSGLDSLGAFATAFATSLVFRGVR